MRRVSLSRAMCLAGLAALAAAGGHLQAQSTAGAPPQQPPAAQQPPPATAQQPVRPEQRQVIRRTFDLITTDVVVRDNRGQFIPDIKKNEFELYEDGVKQDVVSFVFTHGGRIYNQDAPPPPPPMEGIILPPARPVTDTAGRIFIIFVDDLHLDFRNTGRIRDLFKKISKELVHDGDMFAILSTGPSSIEIDLTYDRKRLDEAIKKIMGNALSPKEIMEAPEGQEGPAEIRYRAHVAFSTAYDMISQLEQVHNRRKAFIYVSNGYDFNPYATTRAKLQQERMGQYRTQNTDDGSEQAVPDENPFSVQTNVFAEADLVAQLAELTRAANRANASIYTIDPRGLVGGPDIDENIDMVEWMNHVTATQNSLRTLAELTGGTAVINQNDFSKALQRIDNETSDYYVLGYYSSNPDPLKKRRKIEVKVKRAGANLWYRSNYALKPPPRKK